jgi:5-methyltetrahydropteroyltriglutamate--homocysteine methyltransferase
MQTTDHRILTTHTGSLPRPVRAQVASTTNIIEHPETVCDRICRFANVVGRENIIAGTDCGFATFAGYALVEPQIAWAKLRSLVEGARLATAVLWPAREARP